jgi:long-chain acyl-CoA synthetase
MKVAPMALEVPYRSIPDMFLKRVAATPNGQAFAVPNADDTAMVWHTWAQVGERAKAIAAGLIELGVGLEDRVAILSGTRFEWVLVDLGINCAGAATTTVYPTTEPEDASYIVANSGSKVLIAENAKQALKISGADTSVTDVVLIDGPADAGASPAQITLADLEERGAAALRDKPDMIEDVVAGIGPDHLATLIYTSGTTGRPKGVQLLHRGWVWEGVAQESLGLFESTDLQYLWLPLSHSFGKTLLCGIIHVGVPTYVDGRVDKLVDMLSVVQPTLMCAAPRIFEKVYNKTVTTALSSGGAKAKIFHWAVATGKQRVALQQAGRPIPAGLKIKYAVAEKLVFAKLQSRLGGRLRVLVSGSAPLSRDIAEFFAAANLPIMEGYGMTESSAANFVNRLGRLKIGTVGLALGDLECKIDSDGEVLLRGAPVMRGYHDLPKETAEAFTEDGFLRTGDIGELDADGFLRITDRKKDLVKTSGGKYIAPSAIEGMFKAVCPYTSQAVVVGQARNFVTMLISLDEEAIMAWAAANGLSGKSYAEVAAAPETNAMIAGHVKELNEKLNRWETVKKFAILPRDLSIEAGEITPSMKIKRRNVEANFAQEIDTMYEGSLAQI